MRRTSLVAFLAVCLLVFAFCVPCFGESEITQPVYCFFSNECADCANMYACMQEVAALNLQLPIELICIEEDPERWEKACTEADIPAWGVPRIFIGNSNFAGWFSGEGDLLYIPSYYGFKGYIGQIRLALENWFAMPVRWPE